MTDTDQNIIHFPKEVDEIDAVIEILQSRKGVIRSIAAVIECEEEGDTFMEVFASTMNFYEAAAAAAVMQHFASDVMYEEE